MSRRPIARTLGWLVAAVLVASFLLPFYVWFTLREVRLVEKRAQESEHRAREAEVHLRTTEENHKTAQRELAKTRADLQETISKKLNAERQLAVAQEKFEEFKNGAIPLARFLKEGLGISTPAARSNDVATELRRLRSSQQWQEATTRAMAWLGFHKSFPSPADHSALIEVALLWRRLADPKIALPETAPFKTRQEALIAANGVFEEAEGKVTEAQPNAAVAGNWGTTLRDLANASRDPAIANQYRQNAARLLDIAAKGSQDEDAWLLNRVYLEQDVRRRDPAGFASYCEGIRPFSRVAKACGNVLFALATAKQISVSDSERERLVCKAAKWTAGAPHIQAECDRERHRPHRQ
jgi:hypothetical protein